MKYRWNLPVSTLAAASLFTSCFSIGPDHVAPEAPLNTDWSASDAGAPKTTASPQPMWWKNFGDPVLQDLIDHALAQNLSLESASLRVLEARVNRHVSWTLLAPIPLLGGSAVHANMSQNVKPDVEVDAPDKPSKTTITIGGGPLHPQGKTITIAPDISAPQVSVSDELNVFEVGLDAVWELDLWGKKRRNVQAADAEIDQAFASYADSMVRLVGEVAASYVQLRTYEARKESITRSAMNERKSAAMAKDRKANGSASDLDALQLGALASETEAAIPPLEAAIRQTRNALCILLGKPPGSLDARLAAPAAIPIAPESIAIGIPADLLRRRPDVRRAERFAAAECERIGMAKSELYPSFSLLGSIGVASSHTGDLFDSDSVKGAYGLGVKWNILWYTLVMDAVRIRDAKYQEAIYDYQETVLRAAKEVEDGVAQLAADHQRLAKIEEALAAQKQSVDLCMQMFENGSTEFARVLDALRSYARIEESASEARGATALHAIALYKALGGGWENIDAERIVNEATWKAMGVRTDWDAYTPSPATSSESSK